ncbi:MAG TPA: uroporphyrinogen-III synthase [Candidatus Coprenecus stercoravium]|uniref:Uroporphyrinogen-III synthase n=1 Tax=Candidatus Coprenecus stercoravium TaxID=2840735 RepID=A0A9D2GQH9_9BACT|nr:uroporphyrinogen-III synthase [Candidatus Coprenecus stercoravium]
MKISSILVSQPDPGNTLSPFSEITSKYGIHIDYFPFFRIEPLSAKEFRAQKTAILDYTAIFFSAKSSIDAFFAVCEEMRVTVPETMKYFCTTENIALYLQKHIVYRKRKIFFGKGTVDSVMDTIGPKHKNENFLIASTDATKPEVIKAFTKAGLKFGHAVFSKTVYCDLKEIDLKKYQMVVFYSPSDVKSLIQNYPDFKQDKLLFATYGQSTAKALKDNGLKVEVEAPTPEAPSVSKALMLYLEKQK